ncbi:MAG: peroxiredoxin [Flavobacteriales bacterium]|nr:peroxiredoxin [Flavobacteriales bacterium]
MLDLGTLAPDLELIDQSGKAIRLSDFRGEHNVVLFFYPKDNTLVCTLEMCAFRDAHLDLVSQDAVVIGISVDPVHSHSAVSERWHLPYLLLSDPDGAVSKAYDVGRTWGLFRGRVTYIIDKAGVIRGAIDDPLRAGAHVKKALRTLQAQSTP